MTLSHENLKVYQKAIGFIAWTQPIIESLPAKVSARDQLERASTSIALNIAEGNAKFSAKDRLRFWQFADGSAVECSACLDVLVARKALQLSDVQTGKNQVEEIVRMLAGLRKRFVESVNEAGVGYVIDEDDDEDEDEDED